MAVLKSDRGNIFPEKRGKSLRWMPGKINSFIGTDGHAKHSIATLVIVGAFAAIIIVTILVIVNYWCFRDCENKVPDIVSDLKTIWEIVVPIITLVLGYEFGKSEK